MDSSPTLRETLVSDQPLVATFLLLPRVEIVEMLGRAGFDAVIVDLEHGPITPADLPALAAAARVAGVHAIARVADAAPASIGVALDCGVDGVLVPHVTSVEQARGVVAAGRFPPDGERSLNPYVRGLGYGGEYDRGLHTVDSGLALLAMLEGTAAVKQLEPICGVPGLDGVFVGPVDLSASLGQPGQPEHPVVVEAVQDALRRVRQAGRCSGVYAPTAEAAARWLDAGASLVAVSADAAMILRGFSAMRASVAELRTRAPTAG